MIYDQQLEAMYDVHLMVMTDTASSTEFMSGSKVSDPQRSKLIVVSLRFISVANHQVKRLFLWTGVHKLGWPQDTLNKFLNLADA